MTHTLEALGPPNDRLTSAGKSNACLMKKDEQDISKVRNNVSPNIIYFQEYCDGFKLDCRAQNLYNLDNTLGSFNR